MRRVFAALFALLLVGGLAAPAGAAPQGDVIADGGVMILEPTEGPAGSTFTVRNAEGYQCTFAEGNFVRISANDTVEGSQDITPAGGDDENTGNWTATFTVSPDAEAGTIITVEATCGTDGPPPQQERAPNGFQGFRGLQPEFFPLGVYDPVDFTVTGGPTTTESTTTTEGTTTTTEPPASLPDSETAPDVVQTPTLTG